MQRPHFDFITLFPDAIEVWLRTSILGRALEKELFSFRLVQLRDFSTDRYRSVDDSPYGGGGGMVLRVEPLVAAVELLKQQAPHAEVVSFSPRGERLDTPLIDTLTGRPGPHHWILVCGHYEGLDQRFLDNWVDREVSLGDFVLTGGELPAVAFADALIRRVEGTLSDSSAHQAESFSIRDSDGRRLLEYPHYTRPAEFRGHKVPDVLLSGDHARIAHWRLEQARERTPDFTKS